MEQNILDEIYKISICEKIKNFTNKNNKLCSKINCDKIKNSTKNSKKLQKIENSMKISKIVSSKIKYFSNNHKNIYQLCWCKSWTNRSWTAMFFMQYCILLCWHFLGFALTVVWLCWNFYRHYKNRWKLAWKQI